jgi:hypothetical protein
MNDSFRLTEEACALLRRAPASAWAVYLAGAAPYGVGLIWFWLETTHSAFAKQNLGLTSAAMLLLFVWKQVCEALFLAQLRVLLGGRAGVPVSLPMLILRQTAVQPTALLVLPLALAALFPLPHSLLFYRQFSQGASLRKSLEISQHGGSASLWSLTAVASLGALLLYVNLLVAVVFAAQMSVSVFGVESLDIGALALLRNTTVHFAIGVAVYLALDLLLDAAAALQAFQAVSVRTGEDILAALRRLPVLIMLLLCAASPLAAQPDAQQLDRAIQKTLQQPEFAWRLQPAAEELPPLMAALLKAVRQAGKKIDEWMEMLRRWLEPEDREFERRPRGSSGFAAQYWLYLLIVAIAFAVPIFILRNRTRTPVRPEATPAVKPVDVRDESLLASKLPEDEWLRLAEGYLAQGEPRLALRALHLACLRVLSERGLIAVTRSKTGMDYLDEVRRRSRQKPNLFEQFRQNIGLFELGWYSLHPVSADMVHTYRHGLEQIRSHAA